MSALCQSRPNAPQQKRRYSITSSAGDWIELATSKAERSDCWQVDDELEFVDCTTRKSVSFPSGARGGIQEISLTNRSP
jgi:hypothetical protein